MVNEENFVASCAELAETYMFPARAIKPDSEDQKVYREKKRAQMIKENGGPFVKKTKTLTSDDSAVLLR